MFNTLEKNDLIALKILEEYSESFFFQNTTKNVLTWFNGDLIKNPHMYVC